MNSATNVAVMRDRVGASAAPDEVDTLCQAEAVCQALRELGYTPKVIEFSLNMAQMRENLLAARPAFVFNLVESVEGQGRLIHLAPSLLDALGIPYTGARAEAVFLTSNKTLAKRLLSAAGIATPAWTLDGNLEETGFRPNRPYIIKSQWEHASIGLDEESVIQPSENGAVQLRETLDRGRARLRGDCFVEQFIDGREFNFSILGGAGGPSVLPPAEISFEDYPQDKPRVIGYRAKWVEQSFEFIHTPRRFDLPKQDEGLLARLGEIALKCWTLFGLRGYARVDFRVDASGAPWVLEVNINPCLSLDSGFAAAVEWAGMTYVQAIERIISDSFPPSPDAGWRRIERPAKTAPNRRQQMKK